MFADRVQGVGIVAYLHRQAGICSFEWLFARSRSVVLRFSYVYTIHHNCLCFSWYAHCTGAVVLRWGWDDGNDEHHLESYLSYVSSLKGRQNRVGDFVFTNIIACFWLQNPAKFLRVDIVLHSGPAP